MSSVDVAGSRFSAAVTSFVVGCAFVLSSVSLVTSVVLLIFQTVVFVLAAATSFRFSVYGSLFRRFGGRWKGTLGSEPVAPARFSQMVGATFVFAGTVLVVYGIPVAGWAAVLAVFALSSFLAVSGVCVGCRMYTLFSR